jgi:hypothetical protein
MNKSIKFKNNIFVSSNGITHRRQLLSEILENLLYGGYQAQYTPSQLSQMTLDNRSSIIDTSKSHLFQTNWKDYSSYDHRFSGVLGIFLKASSNSTGGVAIIFFYAGAIGVNVWIDGNRWGGWKWLI